MTAHGVLARAGLGALCAGTVGIAAVGAGAGPAGASLRTPSAVTVNYTAAATAPVMQITEDEPTSTFHPEGEGEYGYTLVTANPSSATALAAVLWPGAAAGNAGTLVGVLGGPDLSALNDPVQASGTSGTSQTHSSVTAPSGSTMSASVDPLGPSDQHSTATSALAGGGLGGAGSVGSSSSTSTTDYDSTTALLSVTAQSKAADIDVGGVVKIGSVTSSAEATASNGQTPSLSGATTFHQMSIAGQAAYVDGSGVHLGSPGAPAGAAAVDSVDTALAASGMTVYFTAPHTITVGGTAYYYAASVLFYWAPPGDTNHNSFTLSLGGSAVSVTDSPEADLFGNAFDTTGTGSTAGFSPGSSAATAPGSAAVSSPVATQSSPQVAGTGSAAPSFGTPASPGPPGGATLSLPASPSAAASSTVGRGSATLVPAATSLPGGIGAGWWVLFALAAIAGAGLTTRVPTLLQRQAAAACPRARNPRSTFGNQRGRP